MLRMGDGRSDEAAAAAGASAGSSPPGQDPRLMPGVIRVLAILAVAALVVPVLASPALLDVTLSATQTVTVPASADAQVLSNFADRNYGSGIRLRSQAKPGQRHESLIRFELPALSWGQSATSAFGCTCATGVRTAESSAGWSGAGQNAS